MGAQVCEDAKLDDTKYSSPMPLIGLYIAAATWVCLLFIVLDIFGGFRKKKRWMPCRFFSLNSVTLTLLSVAAKLPLDLTTSMPSAHDQLSKLTGTTLLCICMGFFMPSLGTNTDSECFTNMAALSILAITVVVNICIQLHTGVIILFRTQHIIVLCCMMLLLMALWFSALYIHSRKEISADSVKDHLTKGQKSLLHRLKKCYLCSYHTNPQFVLCKNLISALVSSLNMLCSIVLLLVAFRSLVSEKMVPCEGLTSDYKWSMRTIVISQIITIFAGCLGTTSRFLTMVGHIQFDDIGILRRNLVEDADFIIANNPVLKGNLQDSGVVIVKILTQIVVFLFELVIVVPFGFVAGIIEGINEDIETEEGYCHCCKICKRNNINDEDIKEFEDLIHKGEMGLDKWTLKKGMMDMKRCVELNEAKTFINVMKILSKTPASSSPAQSLVHLLKLKYESVKPGYKISSLSIVIVVKIAEISLPSSMSGSLLNSLSEVFKIIHFIDVKMNSTSFETKMKSKLTKALWASSNFNSSLLPKILHKLSYDEASQSQLDRAIGIIGGLKEVLHSDFVWDELGIIVDFIQQQVYTSIEELYGYIERLFVDMLNEFLIQLPKVIIKEIVESHPEDYEERVRSALKILCKIECLEALVQWSFPVGSNIINFITDEVSVMNSSENNTNGTNATGDNHDAVSITTPNEIIHMC